MVSIVQNMQGGLVQRGVAAASTVPSLSRVSARPSRSPAAGAFDHRNQRHEVPRVHARLGDHAHGPSATSP